MANRYSRKNIYKSMLLVIVFLLSFQGIWSYTEKVSAATDIIKGIELSKTQLSIGSTSQIRIQLDTVQLPNVREVHAYYEDPSGTGELYSVSLSYNKTSGKYEGTIDLHPDLFLSPGIWKLYSVDVIDGQGNLIEIKNSKVDNTGISQELSMGNFTIISPKGWFYLEGMWFYLDPQTNSLKTGWLYDQNTWYYLDQDGVMQTGWLSDQGKWYYLENSGAMKTGWQLVNGTWYYLENSGAMKTGWLWNQGMWYYLENSGAMKTGWSWNQGTWYYLENSGAMKTGWLYYNGSWYYLNTNGAMKTGWQLVNGTWYYLYNDGHMAANTKINGYKLGGDGAWVY
ncbi:hypothetical protein ACFDTO_38645 [Microbacteriaceae bacterium 4G12]